MSLNSAGRSKKRDASQLSALAILVGRLCVVDQIYPRAVEEPEFNAIYTWAVCCPWCDGLCTVLQTGSQGDTTR